MLNFCLEYFFAYRSAKKRTLLVCGMRAIFQVKYLSNATIRLVNCKLQSCKCPLPIFLIAVGFFALYSINAEISAMKVEMENGNALVLFLGYGFFSLGALSEIRFYIIPQIFYGHIYVYFSFH